MPRAPVAVSMRLSHIIWMFSRAGYTYSSIEREMKILGFGKTMSIGVIKKMIQGKVGWARAPRNQGIEYERRAHLALQIEIEGKVELHLPIPPEELADMGPLNTMSAPTTFIMPDMSEVENHEILGEEAPDTRATAKAAAKAKAGAGEILEELSNLFHAENLVISGGKSLDSVPIPPDVKRLKKGDKFKSPSLIKPGEMVEEEAISEGIYMLGQFWDKSFIVPDRKARAQAIKLAADTLGISDRGQIEMILNKTKALALSLGISHDENLRRVQIAKEAEQSLLPQGGKEIKGAQIMMTRPKMLTAEEFNKTYTNTKAIDQNEHNA